MRSLKTGVHGHDCIACHLASYLLSADINK